jgi:hypothetical protein
MRHIMLSLGQARVYDHELMFSMSTKKGGYAGCSLPGGRIYGCLFCLFHAQAHDFEKVGFVELVERAWHTEAHCGLARRHLGQHLITSPEALCLLS